MADPNGRSLSIPRTGGGLMSLVGKAGAILTPPVPASEIILAGWQTYERGVPHRCVVRCDGWVQDSRGHIDQRKVGFPCAVLQVDYAIGGWNKSVRIDAVNQSALVVWAESIEVRQVWDTTRIARLESFYEISANTWPGACLAQRVAAGITVDDCGPADARYWDIMPFANGGVKGDITETLLEIPLGARAIRMLNGSANDGSIIPFNDLLTRIAWTDDARTLGGEHAIIYQDTIPSDSCCIDVPPVATHVKLQYTTDNLGSEPATPFIVEWIISPEYKVS